MEHPFFLNAAPANRAEALRLLQIAEKLLNNRDLVGSKSFATRARESDPTLSPVTDQILAILDTLIAGDKRINNHHFDYYSILRIPSSQTQNVDFIAEQYRRFAVLLDPQSNSFPFTEQACRLVFDAYSVLSNPMRKNMYDKELGFFRNLYPVVGQNQNVCMPMPINSNADQVFVNLPSQDSGSNAAGLSFSRDPQAGISMPMSSMASSGMEQQPATFLRQQTQPVTSISFSKADEQPATFLNLNQPQPVNSVRSLNRENQQLGTGSSSTQRREQVVSVEKHGHQRENPQFGVGSSSKQGREQVVSAEKHGNQGGNPQFGIGSSSTQGGEQVVSAEQRGNQQEAPQFGIGSSSPQGREEERVHVFFAEQHGNKLAQKGNENMVGNNASKSASASENVKEKEGNADASGKKIPSFWTACPCCLSMYEYSVDYTNRYLSCQNCNKAFQAVPIASPPPIVDGKELNFCSWGFMPFGLCLEDFNRNIDSSSWSPFSPMFTCPRFGGNGGGNVKNHAVGGQSNVNKLGSLHNAGGSVSGVGRKNSAPTIYIVDDEEDDVFVEVSGSDEEWSQVKERKKAKNGKRKSARTGTPSKNAKKQQAGKTETVEGKNGVSLQDGLATQGGVEMSHVVAVESSKRGVASKTRRHPGRFAKHFGNLDLNVEFSNEVEEPKIQMSNVAGEGDDDTVEVIGFFDGLDEFLSGLPILDAVDGDKIEAA
ncbi:putative metallocarboxypeptidase inhibitor-like [Capsicum annuum]|nr:putative metallocarboxypeptidase inhibitor-like [Capsicum annuum]